MDKRVKNAMREAVGQQIDLNGVRLKENELNILGNLVSHFSEYAGQEKVKKYTSTGISSDGKYERTVENIYTVCKRGGQIGINYLNRFKDDDGMRGESERFITNGREILSILKNVFRE